MTGLVRPRLRLAFVVGEDWFFVSHFLPMLRAAKALDFEIVVITRVSRHAAAIERHGGRIVPFNVERGQLGLLSLSSSIARIAQILRQEQIDLIHCIGLRCIVTGGLAALLSRVQGRVMAVTGGGLLFADTSAKAAAGQAALRWLSRLIRSHSHTHFLFENYSDPQTFGLDAALPYVTILGGAGVDPDFYTPAPFPYDEGLKLAMVCRMIWSKGVDLAVTAVSMARERGNNVSLSLFGGPDPSNPRSISTEMLSAWSALPGVQWNGATSDVRRIWAEHDISILPTRGGEGLPRSILEAAACGRPILTTDVPGCRDFVRDGCDGWLVPVDDAAALSERICALAGDKAAVVAAGASARQRVLDGYTETRVMEQVQEVYRQVTNALIQRRL